MKLIVFFYTDVPSPVTLTDTSKAKINSSKITLKWTKPESNGADIYRYMVYRRTVNEEGKTSEWDLATKTSALSSVVTLERGETFDLIVTAKNKCGESEKEEGNAKRVQVSEGKIIHTSFFFFF